LTKLFYFKFFKLLWIWLYCSWKTLGTLQ
jgi:hypothetical protein